MSHVLIPATVPASGPQFTHFPAEVLVMIFNWAIWLELRKTRPVSATEEEEDDDIWSPFAQINEMRFSAINKGNGPLSRIRLVSKECADLVMVAFYETNFFRFAPPCGLRGFINQTPWLTTIPPALPPIVYRKNLRRMHLEIFLEDQFWTFKPGNLKAIPNARGMFPNYFTSVNELMAFSPGARLLYHFGEFFPNLKALRLCVTTDFNENHFPVMLNFFVALRIKIDAEKLEVSVANHVGAETYWHELFAQFLCGTLEPELQKEVDKSQEEIDGLEDSVSKLTCADD